MADTGIPEPKPGLVTEAHGGILFIDEIGEMDPMLLNKLLKVMEDKRVRFESAYYDEDDPNVPQYIRRLFAEGAPADFILIGATTRDPSEINPAIRSRCAEIFFEPLIPTDIEKIVSHAAEQLGASLEDGVAKSIAEFTIEGRKASTFWPIPTDWPYSSRERRIRFALPRTMSVASPRSAASFPM